jgi:diadenosine tetraphosphate (Ap4A) HIT family hydrolase
MTSDFVLNNLLQEDSCGSIELDLCRLLLVNNTLFPWVILVPKHNFLKEIIDLGEQDRIKLMQEISLVCEMMQKIFNPDKLNVAALGNIVEQLHIHVIVRDKNDKAWPNPVFGFEKIKYSEEQSTEIIKQFREYLDAK